MPVGRRGRSPTMVGRDRELDELRQLVGHPKEPVVALVAGEAGLGKTRLVQELAAGLADDVVVLCGQADPGGLGQPFGLLLDALGSSRPAAGPDGGSSPGSAEVDVLLDPSRPLEARVRVATDLLDARRAGRAAVVAFEDLHWADAESLALLGWLAEAGTPPLALVGTYRPDAITRRHPAGELLTRLERRVEVTHVRLDRLDPADVGRFLATTLDATPPARLVEALHARTGGNPFFLEELLAAAPSDDLDGLATQPLPWSLSEAVLAQVDDLDDLQRAVLEAASVLGRRVHFDLLAAVTDHGEDALIDALRALVRHGVLEEAESDVFAFRHELAREVVAGQLLGRERRRLHEAALAALEATEAPDPAVVAHHAQGAGRYDVMVDAARRGAATRLAAGSTHSALQLAELGLTEGEDAGLREVAARAAWLAGLIVEARAHAERWLALLDAAMAPGAVDVAGDDDAVTGGDATVARVEVLRILARSSWELGDEAGTTRWLARLRDVVDDLEGAPRARALAAMAQIHMLTNRSELAIDWADQAIALATELGLDDVRVAARVERASAFVRMGPDPEGTAELEQAAEEAARLDLPMLESRALNNLLWVDLLGPPRAVTIERIERMRSAAERVGFEFLAVGAHHEARAWLAVADGDLAGARAWATGPIQVSYAAGPVSWKSNLVAADLAVEAGRLDEAERLVAESDATTEPAHLIHALCMTAAVHALRGDGAAAADVLDRLVQVPDPAWCSMEISAILRLAGALRHGEADLAPLLGRLDRFRGSSGWPMPGGSVLVGYIDALLAEQAGDPVGARSAYDTLLAVAAGRVPAPLLGTAAVAAGRLAAAAGDLDAARDHAATGAGHLARWGGWRVVELDTLRRRVGLGADAVAGPDLLTPREREVVALLAEGLTNAELAERLYISPRTAGVHVSNVLAKLGMANRSEIAAWAVREGLAS